MRFAAVLLNAVLVGAAGLAFARYGWPALALGALAVAAVTWWTGRKERAVRLAVASSAHELRTPLAVVRGAVELVRDRAKTRLTPKEDGFLADALRSVETIQRLIRDLGGAVVDPPLQLEAVELGPLLLEAASDARTRHPQAQLTDPAPLTATARGDRLRLRQVLDNLLENALATGAPVELLLEVAEGRAVVRVLDHGPGIPPVLRATLFEPFATGRRGGSGLGLYVSRRLAERMGGALEVERSGPEGTVFALRLPLAG